MRKHLAAAGIALGSVLGGAVFGATAFAPTVSGAQEAPDATPEAADCPHPGGPGRGPGGPGLDAAATAIGIDADELREALHAGQTIAEIATAHGVDVQTVIDAMVADATEHITDRVNGEEQPPPPAGDED